MTHRVALVLIVLVILVGFMARQLYTISSAHVPSQLACFSLDIPFIEITQATQTDDNSIPLIDGRRTGIRVFATGMPEGCVARSMIEIIPSSPSRPSYSAWSENGDLPIDLFADRADEDDSFNFTFVPDGWEGQSYEIIAHVWPVSGSGTASSTVECAPPNPAATQSVQVNLEKVCPPDIGAIRVAMPFFSGPEGEAPSLGQVRPGRGDAMMWGAYPFTEYDNGFSHARGYRLLTDDAQIINGNPTSGKVWTLVERQFRNSPRPDFVIAWLGHAPTDRLYGGEGFFDDNRSWTLVAQEESSTNHIGIVTQEVGHNFGFDHEDFGEDLGEIGWDVFEKLQPSHLRPVDYTEYMEFGYLPGDAAHTWTGDEAYTAIQNLNLNQCVESAEAVRPVPIYPPSPTTSAWSIGPSFGFESTGAHVQPTSAGKGRIDVLANSGSTLYSTQFNPVSCAERGDCIDSYQSVLIPDLPSAQKMTLYIDNTIQDTITRTDNSPQLLVHSPVSGQSLAASTVISWTVTDLNGGAITTLIDYSHDGSYPISGINAYQRAGPHTGLATGIAACWHSVAVHHQLLIRYQRATGGVRKGPLTQRPAPSCREPAGEKA